MNKPLLKIGTSNFRKLVSTDGVTADLNRLFVDKTLFIKKFLDHSNDVVLVTRPRRWGKSLALSMVQHFVSKEVDGLPTAGLFQDLKIAEYLEQPEYKKYYGTHPVILVSFKDLKGETFEELVGDIAATISDLYKEHDYLLNGLRKRKGFSFAAEETYENYANEFVSILNRKSDVSSLKKSIKTLSALLCDYYGKKVFILIDEYDNAINYAFDKPELLTKISDFFSVLFSSCFKENDSYLEKGLITGILRIAKANIFSGLNNPSEETILDNRFSDCYGFTELEVDELLAKASFNNKSEIKAWYNGYVVGGYNVYNPWSIMACIDNYGHLEPYWSNTANPKMIEDLLINKSSVQDKLKVRNLIKNKEATLDVNIKKKVSFDDLANRPEILWSLLIHTGYLTLHDMQNNQVKLPNNEISLLIKDYVNNWFKTQPFLTGTANSLLAGDFTGFEEALRAVLTDQAFSARIFGGGGRAARAPATHLAKEFMYQFLLMTELRCVNLAGDSEYEVFSELERVSREKTRPDVIILNHKDKLCIVIEIKVANFKVNDLDKLATEDALGQILKNQYGKVYQEEHGYELLPMGIAFKGNDFVMAY